MDAISCKQNPSSPSINRIENDFINQLPNEMLMEIFSRLSALDALKCTMVNKRWLALADYDQLSEIINPHLEMDGKKKWKSFGDIGKVPPLPKNIAHLLNSDCPIWEGKKVKQTHTLVLVPKKVNEKRLTLKSFEELIKTDYLKNEKGYRNISSKVIEEHGDKSIKKSCWVLMTNVLPESRNRSYAKQVKIIGRLRDKSKVNYQVPNALLATVCIIMGNFKSYGRLFCEDKWLQTRCQEKVRDSEICVGCYTPPNPTPILIPAGVLVDFWSKNSHNIGVSAQLIL